MSRGSRYQRSFRGLVGALVAVLLAIAFVWGLSRFQHHSPPNPADTIDYSATLSTAQHKAPFHLLSPQPEPKGWRATSADFTPRRHTTSWHLGFLTDNGEYVGLEQSTKFRKELMTGKTRADQPKGTVRIDGTTWHEFVSSDGGETALVRRDQGVTTLVTGTASLAALKTFVRALR